MYCSVADVQKLIPATEIWDSSDSAAVPAIADVTDWITQLSNYIDSRLSRRYTVPITGDISLSALRSICARLVALRVWGTVFTGKTGVTDHPEFWDAAEKELTLYADGKANLSDAVPLGQELTPGTPTTSLPVMNPVSPETANPAFSMSDIF